MFSLFSGRVERSGNRYFCMICNRVFFGLVAILSHCRNTTKHEWCEVCMRVFPTEEGLTQHRENSSAHHICFECDDEPDFDDEGELEEHLVEEHYWCEECNEFQGSRQDLQHHIVEDHNGCGTCYRGFDSENNRDQHMVVHAKRNINCPRCDRSFTKFSHLIGHLEASFCTEPRELKRLVFRYPDREDFTTHFRDASPFYCENCERPFSTLTGLYQHVEGVSDCSDLLYYPFTLGELKEWILENLN